MSRLNRSILIIPFVPLTLCFAHISASAQNLVVNGGFEAGTLDPWISNNNVDVVGGFWNHHSGGRSLDLSGGGPVGSIFQDVATNNGQSYQVGFYMAGNFYGGPDIKQMDVYWGDQYLGREVFDKAISGSTLTNVNWSFRSYNVIGTSNDRLRFVSFGDDDGFGPTLDDISVSPVPAPSALAAFVIGAVPGAVVLLRRRRKA